MFKFEKNLKNKILIPILVIVVVSSIVTTALNYATAHYGLRKGAEENLLRTSKDLGEQLTSFLEERSSDVRHLAMNTDVVNSAAYSTNSAAKILGELLNEVPVYNSLAVTNKTGMDISDFDTASVGKLDLKTRDYFLSAIAGKFYITDVFKSKRNGKLVFTLAQPIKNNNEIVGVMAGTVAIEAFTQKYITPVKVGENGYVYVVDNKGMILAHPDSTKILSFDISKTEWGEKFFKWTQAF